MTVRAQDQNRVWRFSQRSKPRVQGSVGIFSHQTRRCSLVRRDSPTGRQVRLLKWFSHRDRAKPSVPAA
jgi:hypothetical protein